MTSVSVRLFIIDKYCYNNQYNNNRERGSLPSVTIVNTLRPEQAGLTSPEEAVNSYFIFYIADTDRERSVLYNLRANLEIIPTWVPFQCFS